MEIFQLLEAIRPADKVITVQINNTADYLSYILTLTPSIVAIAALWFSSRQFKVSIKNQAKLAQINARLVTDIELKKEWCRDVRRLCIECLTYGTDSHIAKQRLQYIEKQHADGHDVDSEEHRQQAVEQNVNFYKMLECSTLLQIYLVPSEHDDFFASIRVFTNLVTNAESTALDIGNARGACVAQCQAILLKMNKEIAQVAGEI